MKPSINAGLFLFNAVMIPITGTFGPPTPVWLAMLQIAALILPALAVGVDAFTAGQEEAEQRWSESKDRAYHNGYSAGYKAANDEVRKAVDGWFNV